MDTSVRGSIRNITYLTSGSISDLLIEEGANMLRIGSLVFPRDVKK
jgi:hypothetical protein